MLTVTCPQCRKPSRIRPEAIGQKIRCPHCSLIMIVPARDSGLLPEPVASMSGKMSDLDLAQQAVELGNLDDDDDADPDDVLGRPNPSMRKSFLPLLPAAPASPATDPSSILTPSGTAIPPTRRITRPSPSSVGPSSGMRAQTGSMTKPPSGGRLASSTRHDSPTAEARRGDFALRMMNYAAICFFLPLIVLFLEVIVNILLPLRERDTPGFLGFRSTQDEDIVLLATGIAGAFGGVLMMLSRVQLLRLATWADARTLGVICLVTTTLGLAAAAMVARNADAKTGDPTLACSLIVATGSLLLAETSFHLLLVTVGHTLRLRHIARDVMVLPLLLVGIAMALAITYLTTNYLTPPKLDTRTGFNTVGPLQDEFRLLIVGIQLVVGLLIVGRYRAVISRVRQGLMQDRAG